MGVVLDDEVQKPGRRWWIPVVALINITALGIAGWALFLRPPTLRPQVQLAPQKGSLDMDALNDPLDEFSKQTQVCYQTGLKKDAKLKGDVVLTLRIDLDGNAVAKIGTSSLTGAAKKN
ncbi:MAG: hypothetical protein GY822_32940 [Deltaproteobacteria bacterium]|nr:hypothetical protein [Deltaproteobacteria bacterium]